MRQLIITILLLFVGLELTGCGGVFFVPDRHLIREPSSIGLDFEDVWIDFEGGGRLHGWFLPSKGPAHGTIVFLHGNAQNISYHIASVAWLTQEHYNVFLYDYRGFGQSSGKSNPRNAIDDFSEVIETVTNRFPESREGIVVFGQSLGAALAIGGVHRVKDQAPIRGLILDSAFSDFRGIAQEKLNGLFGITLIGRFLSLSIPKNPNLIAMISDLPGIPILIIHGEMDSIVPVTHSLKLFSSAGKSASLWLEPDAQHIAALRNPLLRKYFVSFLENAYGNKGLKE